MGKRRIAIARKATAILVALCELQIHFQVGNLARPRELGGADGWP